MTRARSLPTCSHQGLHPRNLTRCHSHPPRTPESNSVSTVSTFTTLPFKVLYEFGAPNFWALVPGMPGMPAGLPRMPEAGESRVPVPWAPASGDSLSRHAVAGYLQGRTCGLWPCPPTAWTRDATVQVPRAGISWWEHSAPAPSWPPSSCAPRRGAEALLADATPLPAQLLQWP